MKQWKIFEDFLELIKSKKIRDFLEKAFDNAPPEFYTAPASSTGKNHPPEDNVKGGLVIHTKKVIRVANALCHFFGIEEQLLKDKIFAGCILHDVCKNGNPWCERTDPEHGFIAARWLAKIAAIESNPEIEDFIHIDKDLMDIIDLVRNHMGIYNKLEPTLALKIGEIITEKDICHLIVQLSDYIASRKWLSFSYKIRR